MTRPQDKHWLDKAIENTAPGNPPEPDFKTWQQQHAQALASLHKRAQKSTRSRTDLSAVIELGRRIMRSPITKLAIAAVFIAGCLFLARHLKGSDTVPAPQPTIVKKTEPMPSIEGQVEKTLLRELALAQSLYEQKDLPALLTLLETSPEAVQLRIVEFLSEIGDASVVPALQRLADVWQGLADENVFQRAIDAIKKRLEDTPEMKGLLPVSQAVEPNESSAQITPSGVTFQGVVKNEADEPVQGVHVWGQRMWGAMQFRLLPEETLTDAQGHFALAVNEPVAGTILYYDHPDYALGVTNDMDILLAKPDRNVDVTLYAPASVAGVVKDVNGHPIGGAVIEATVEFKTNQWSDHLYLYSINGMATDTDDHGAFQIGRLPKQARLHLRISCDGYGLYSTQRDYHGNTYPILAGDKDLEIVLEPGGFIHGQIRYDDGRAHTDPAAIVLETHDVQESFCHTDGQGRFTTTGLIPGTYRLSAISSGSEVLCAPVEVVVDLSSEGNEVVFLIHEASPVQVRVVDEKTQRPLPEVFVYAQASKGASQTVATGRTDAKGLCRLNLQPGQYVVEAQGWQAGRIHSFFQEVVVLSDSKDLSVEIAISKRPHIQGWLVDRKGFAVQGFVQIDGTHMTDANGLFSVPEPFGDLMEDHLCYAFDQTRQLGVGFFWSKSEKTGDLVLVLEPVATVTGRVMNADGTVCVDVAPQLWTRTSGGGWRNSAKNPWQLKVGQDGVFVFTNVPVGMPVDVHAEKPGFQVTAKLGDLSGGQTIDTGDVALKGISGIDETTDWTGILKGRVIDEEGNPVVGYKVDTGIGTSRFEDSTDRKGRFELKGLPLDKRLYVGLYVPGYGHCYQNVTPDGNDLVIQIFPQGWDLLGKKAPPLKISRWFNSDPETLTHLNGQVVLLQIGVLLPNYSRDLSRMLELVDKYADQGLEIIAIHQPLRVTWAGKVSEVDIEQYLIDQAVPFAFCLDKGGSNGETYAQYDVKATPALYLIDKTGHVRISPTPDNLDTWVKQLLAE